MGLYEKRVLVSFLSREITYSLLALAILGYVMQPWSLQFGEMPIQVIFVFAAFGMVILRKGLRAISVISKGAWLCILLILFSLVLRYLLDRRPVQEWLQLFQVITGIALAVTAAHAFYGLVFCLDHVAFLLG